MGDVFDMAVDLDADEELPEMASAKQTQDSQDSIHSGRQIQPDYGFEEPSGEISEQVIPETVLEADEILKMDSSTSDSSPLPSLEEIFHSATTSRRQTSPLKAATAAKSKMNSDPIYEEAMRRLDEGEGSDASSHTKMKRSLFPNSTQPVAPTKKTEETATSQRPRRRSSTFKVPDGSQVISIGSSPAPAEKELYAEDSVDETYRPRASGKQGSKGRKKLPSGTGARTKKSKQPVGAAKGRRKKDGGQVLRGAEIPHALDLA
jgi:hypothetical protein